LNLVNVVWFGAAGNETLIETVLIIGVCVIIGRAAELDGHSPVVWATITFALCIMSLALPFPLIGVLMAGATAYVAKFVYNLRRKPAEK
jgi:hypothetical protein